VRGTGRQTPESGGPFSRPVCRGPAPVDSVGVRLTAQADVLGGAALDGYAARFPRMAALDTAYHHPAPFPASAIPRLATASTEIL
jgi:hypothetical protein